MIINTKNIIFKKDDKGDYFEYVAFKNITVKKDKLIDILNKTYFTLDQTFTFGCKKYYYDGRVPYRFIIDKHSFPIEGVKKDIRIKVYLNDLRFEYLDMDIKDLYLLMNRKIFNYFKINILI